MNAIKVMETIEFYETAIRKVVPLYSFIRSMISLSCSRGLSGIHCVHYTISLIALSSAFEFTP